MLLDFTPDIIRNVQQMTDIHQGYNYLSKVAIFIGKMNVSVFCRNRGAKAFNISNRFTHSGLIPDNTIIVGVSVDNGVQLKSPFKLSEDRKVVDGFLGNEPAQFYHINLADMMISDSGYVRIPELSLIFGLEEKQLNALDLFETEFNRTTPLLRHEHGVGALIVPVVEPEDSRAGQSYFINTLGCTYEIACKTTTETNLPAGVYKGVSTPELVGSIDELLYKCQDSLQQDIVLFSNRSDADRYRTVSNYMKGLAESAKAEVIKLEKELTEIKSKTTKEDNAVKVETLKAKGEYESKSLGRKDALEETSFARSATLGFAALATASMGIILKMGMSVTLADMFVAGFGSTAVRGGILAAFVNGEFLKESVATVVKAITFIPKVVYSVGGLLVGSLVSGLTYVARGVGGLARGAGRLVSKCFGFAF